MNLQALTDWWLAPPTVYPLTVGGSNGFAYTTTYETPCRRKCKNCACAECTSCPCKDCKIERLEARVAELEKES